MKSNTLIRSASAVLALAALTVSGPGCSKGKQNPPGSNAASGSTAAGQSDSSVAPAASASDPAPRAQVGNTPVHQLAHSTGQSKIGAPLIPAGIAPQIAAIDLGIALAPEAPKPISAPEPECFRASFRHNAVSSHSSDEICSQHQNLLVLKHKNVNGESLCVRVNGKPVRFERMKGHPDQIIIGAVAGPKAEITANYCVGKARCQEDCKIPKDEFLDAIGGTEEVGQHLGKWLETDQDSGDAVAAQLDSELKKELAELEDKGELFKGWNGDSEVRECGSRGLASAQAPKGQKAAVLKR